MKRNGAAFWRDRDGYMATYKWWLLCGLFRLSTWKQRACRLLLGRSFLRKGK